MSGYEQGQHADDIRTEDVRPVVRVASALILRDGRMLAGRRVGGAFDGGWELPGGKVEAGETAAQAAARECEEELAVTPTLVRRLDDIDYDYPDFHLSMAVFTATLAEDGQPRPTIHSCLRWLGPDELEGVEWLPADVEFIRQLPASWEQLP